MKGELHKRLQAALHQAWKAGVFKQESLNQVMEKSQRSVSQYLNGETDAGALDLDEAAAALEHIGSNLPDFLAGVPPRSLTATEKTTRALQAHPLLVELVLDLEPVPKTKLADVIELTRDLAHLTKKKRGGGTPGSQSGPPPGRRTTKAPKKRR